MIGEILEFIETMRGHIKQPTIGSVWIGRDYSTHDLLEDLDLLERLLRDVGEVTRD